MRFIANVGPVQIDEGSLSIRERSERDVYEVGWHDMRHTAATLLLQAGIPPVVVAGILGHSPAVLMSTYAHALPDAKRDAVGVLADLYRVG